MSEEFEAVVESLMNMPVPEMPILDRLAVTQINADNLGDVLENHTGLFDHYTNEIPHIRYHVTQLKIVLARARSALALALRDKDSIEYRHAVDQYGSNGKLTEKTIEAIVATDSELATIEDRLNKWQRALGDRERIRDVFLAREGTIRASIQLYISGYWGPSTRGEDSPRVSAPATGRVSSREENESNTPKTKRDSLGDMGRGSRDSRRRDYDTRNEDRQNGGRKRFRRRAQ